MANKMTSFCLSLITSFICITPSDIDLQTMELNPMHYPPMECYSSQLKIGKHTLATTDSYRDTEMIQLIFPEAIQEYVPHFHQDECARLSKLYLPFTCFKLHAPQTWQLEEGYLSIKTLEHEYTKKFYAVINGYSQYSFDAFFDNSVAFWVLDLDKYLQQINNNHHILTSYVGLKWYHKSVAKTFYSLIIQSPHSQRVFELISFNKPDLSSYPNLRSDFKWKLTSVIRASFKQYPIDEYPWTGYVGTIYKLGLPIFPTIVPIRISYAVANLAQQLTFYTDIMEAKLLDSEHAIIDSLDDMLVSYAFVQTVESVIEIQFIERAEEYTYGTFTISMYGDLLRDTHNDVISGVYCGLDRWFDNHYGYDTSGFYEEEPGYLDRVFFNAFTADYKYRIYYIGHQRDEAYVDSDSFDIESVDDLYGLRYKLYVFDPNGQTIQMIGYFRDTFLEKQPPIYNKQWCATPCPNDQAMGEFDGMADVYDEDVTDVVYQLVFGDGVNGGINGKFNVLLVIIICVVCVILMSIGVYCGYVHCKVGVNGDANVGQETQCLLSDK